MPEQWTQLKSHHHQHHRRCLVLSCRVDTAKISSSSSSMLHTLFVLWPVGSSRLFLILLNMCCCSVCRGLQQHGEKACTRVMSDCKLATTVESLSTDGRKRHERKVFLWIVRTLRRNMHHVWAIQDVLLADPSKKNKNGAKPLNRSVVYIIANNPKKSNGLGQWMLRLFAATARGNAFLLVLCLQECWLLAAPMILP